MKIFLIGWFGAGNIGDEAILLSELLSIRERREGVRFYILSFNPRRTERLTANIPEVEKIVRMGTKKNFFKSDFKGLLDTFRRVDTVVIGGGGIFQDIYNYYPIPFFTIMALATKFFRKLLVFYSVGIGPVNTSIGKKMCRIAANSADVLSVRDEESKDLLSGIGVTREIHVSADPVFLLKSVWNEKVESIVRTRNIVNDKPVVGICVQDLLSWSNIDKKILADVLDTLAREKGARILFLPMGAYQDGWFSKETSEAVDVAASKEIADMIKGDYSILTDDINPQELMSVIGRLDLIISMRLHGVIMGVVMGVPVIALTYREEPKITNLMRRIGCEEDLFYVDNLNAKRLLERIEYIFSKGNEIKQKIKEKASLLGREAEKSIELLSGIL
jgi:polysaccharide pyruvyl transferase CsaB